MITFSVEFGKASIKDGSMPIYIRISSGTNRKRVKMPAPAQKDDVKRGELTNQLLAFAVDERIMQMRRRLIKLGVDADRMSFDMLADYLANGDNGRNTYIDFIAYSRKQIDNLINEGRESTASNYKAALNNFVKFVGKDSIDINDITKKMLLQYKEWFFADGSHKDRAWECYMGNLQALHNMAKAEFNDADEDEPIVRRSPFATIEFKRPRAEVRKIEKRALPAEAIRLIYNLPDKEYTEEQKRFYKHTTTPICNMARDAFLISFGLCGMNAVDIYNHTGLGEDMVVKFYRQKTARRSGDGSYTEVTIPKAIRGIYERNIGTKGHSFSFAERYSGMGCFTPALNDGLKSMVKWMEEYYGKTAEEMGVPTDLTFYAARHSWATIAANDCGIPIEVVDRALCHAVNSVAAESYVKRDFSVIDRANEKVMQFVFGEQ